MDGEVDFDSDADAANDNKNFIGCWIKGRVKRALTLQYLCSTIMIVVLMVMLILTLTTMLLLIADNVYSVLWQ